MSSDDGSGQAEGIGGEDRLSGGPSDQRAALVDDISKLAFSQQVKRWFLELTQVAHMEPNQAAALALKIAAGLAEVPIMLSVVMQSLDTAAEAASSTTSTPSDTAIELSSMQDAAAKLYRLFSSMDSLHATFWCRSGDVDSSPPQEGGAGGSQGGSTAQHAPPSEQDKGVHSNGLIGIHGGSILGSGNLNGSEGIGGAASASQDSGPVVSASHQTATPAASGTATQPLNDHSTSAPAEASLPADDPGLLQLVQRLAGSGDEGSSAAHSGSSELRQGQGRTVPSLAQQGIDLAAITELYSKVMALHNQRVTTSLISASERLLMTIASIPPQGNPGLLRQLLVIAMNPLLEEPEHADLLTSLCSALVAFSPQQKTEFVELLAALPMGELRKLVIVLQQYITITLYQQQAITRGIEMATKVLGLLNEANSLPGNLASSSSSTGSGSLPAQRDTLPYQEFYNDAVNNEDFNLKEDFRKWKSLFRSEFSFCAHPYVFDPASKARILQMECQLTQYNELHSALFRGLFGSSSQGSVCPFFVLKVRRGAHLVQDTLVQVHHAKEQGTLRKPLKVKFVGEEGVDEGGVQKEFFQLLVRELFNPDYGMFIYDERVRLHWFRPSHLDMQTEFELVGILIGLAIYNSHILEFSFPLVLYKLLVGVQPCLDDLKELYPEVHLSLTKLLAMSPVEVESCGLCFSVDVEFAFSQIETVELLPGKGNTEVSTSNRHLYVELYTQHLLQRCVQQQLDAFRRGFLRLCSGAALQWFRPEELELLVCGGRDLDLTALETATLYDDGYTRDSIVVRWFWNVVHALPAVQQKKLLAFVTGSDRVPIKGLAALNPPFVISKMGGDPDRLPTAHTCFNHLLLPTYSSQDNLHKRLLMALENAEGFGLM